MTWVNWLGWACVAVNLAAAGVCFRNIRRLHRAQNETAAMQAWYATEAERIMVLDTLLMRFCVEAAGSDCSTVWQASAQTLGEIGVRIEGRVRGRAWSAEGSLPGGTEHVPGLFGPDVNDN